MVSVKKSLSGAQPTFETYSSAEAAEANLNQMGYVRLGDSNHWRLELTTEGIFEAEVLLDGQTPRSEKETVSGPQNQGETT